MLVLNYAVIVHFQTVFTPIIGCEEKIGVLALEGSFWGVCIVDYSKSDTPDAQIKCVTCVRSGCDHVKALQVELGKDNGEDDALSLFQHALLAPPVLRMRYEKTSTNDAKIPVFPGSEYYFYNSLCMSDLYYSIQVQ